MRCCSSSITAHEPRASMATAWASKASHQLTLRSLTRASAPAIESATRDASRQSYRQGSKLMKRAPKPNRRLFKRGSGRATHAAFAPTKALGDRRLENASTQQLG